MRNGLNIDLLATTETNIYKGHEVGFDYFINLNHLTVYANNKERTNLHYYGSLRYFLHKVINEDKEIKGINAKYKKYFDHIIDTKAYQKEKEAYTKINWITL